MVTWNLFVPVSTRRGLNLRPPALQKRLQKAKKMMMLSWSASVSVLSLRWIPCAFIQSSNHLADIGHVINSIQRYLQSSTSLLSWHHKDTITHFSPNKTTPDKNESVIFSATSQPSCSDSSASSLSSSFYYPPLSSFYTITLHVIELPYIMAWRVRLGRMGRGCGCQGIIWICMVVAHMWMAIKRRSLW